MNQERWKSVLMWTAIIAQVLSLLILTNVINMQEAELIRTFLIGILNIFTIFGFINSPTTKGAL